MPTNRIRRLLCATVAAALLVLPAAQLSAQGARSFSIFLDCSGFYCEPDFYRTDIGFVDHVRERVAADVHVLVTRQQTGGGGAAYVLAFYGQQRFKGVDDTLLVNTTQGATEAETRQALSRTVKLGLARYVARTVDAPRASLSLTAPAAGAPTVVPTRDPWNAWVFRLSANVNASRERGFGNNSINGNVNATRITELWKSNLRVSENYNDQSFTVDGEKVTRVRRDFNGAVQQVRSLGERWSTGLRADAGSSTFLNQKLYATAAPVVEYNVFPYKEFTRRALVFQYAIGAKHFTYEDTTVFFKTKETRPYQGMIIGLEQRQQWGSLEFQVDGFHFLDDLGKSRLTFDTEAEIRIIKGLNLNLYANYSVLHDQLYLPKGDSSREDVLLRQTQLATTYRAFMYMGLSYTFGSVLNNVVNPRLSSGSRF